MLQKGKILESIGFTLIEILLVVMIIGILTAVLVPRALRTNVEAKYMVVRQAANELGSWGMEWSNRNLESQSPTATCNLNSYIQTLTGYVGDKTNTNWIKVSHGLSSDCRSNDNGINYSVKDIVSPQNQPRNPFNGASYFNSANNGKSVQSGLIYLAEHSDKKDVHYYYFVFTGTDSDNPNDWHAGMGQGENPNLQLQQLRNGIFMTRQAE